MPDAVAEREEDWTPPERQWFISAGPVTVLLDDEQYRSWRASFAAGEPEWEGVDLYGSPTLIVRAKVDGAWLETAEAIRRCAIRDEAAIRVRNEARKAWRAANNLLPDE